MSKLSALLGASSEKRVVVIDPSTLTNGYVGGHDQHKVPVIFSTTNLSRAMEDKKIPDSDDGSVTLTADNSFTSEGITYIRRNGDGSNDNLAAIQALLKK